MTTVRRADKLLAYARDGILIIPGIHILVCLFFLFFYYATFGYGIENFGLITDVFNTSFSDIALFYISFAISHSINVAMKIRRGDHVADQPVSLDSKFARIAIIATTISVAFVFYLGIRYFILTGYIAPNGILILVGLPVVIGLVLLTNKLSFVARESFIALCLGAALLLSNAINSAQRDKYTSYAEMRQTHGQCGSYVVLRKIGEHFLAVAPDNSRVLVGSDCKIFVLLFNRTSYRPLHSPEFGKLLGTH